MSKKAGLLVSIIIVLMLLFQIYCVYNWTPSVLDSDTYSSSIDNYQSAEVSWLEGWGYRKTHVILGGTDVSENFQISLIVHYGVGEDTSNEVYCGSHCRNDFGDLRFTSADGVTEYDYWIQNCTSGVQALFWVEITENLNITRTIYIYYGQPHATTTSNGTATFRFFEDFSRSDSEIVGNGWSEDENQTQVAIENEALKISGAQHRYAHVERPCPQGVNLVLEGKIYMSSSEMGNLATAISLYWSDHVWVRTGWRSCQVEIMPDPLFFSQENDGDGASTGGVGIPWESGNRWYNFRIVLGYLQVSHYSLDYGYTWNSMPCSMVRPPVYAESPSFIILGRGYSNNPNGSMPYSDLDNIDEYPLNEAVSYIDDVFVRNYGVYPPQHNAYGSEELNPAVDYTDPIVSHPPDISFEVGTTNHTISWVCSDTNPHNYTIWKNDVFMDSGNWSTNPMTITVVLDGLTEGVYTYSLVVLDDFYNMASDDVTVTVTAVTTDGNPEGFPSTLTLGIIIGSTLIIVVAVVLIVKRGKPG